MRSRGMMGQKAGEVIQTSETARSDTCQLLAGQSPAECSIISIGALQFRGL